MQRAFDSTLARAGCLWANRHGVGRAYVERVLLPFWAARLDIEDPQAIANVLAEVGAPGFDGADASALAKHQADLEERGVFNVPTFLVEDEHFVGRQHLPMIPLAAHRPRGRRATLATAASLPALRLATSPLPYTRLPVRGHRRKQRRRIVGNMQARRVLVPDEAFALDMAEEELSRPSK